MARLPAWAVGAAILHRKREIIPVETLATYVIETQLSGLGVDGETPGATLRTQLRQKSTPALFAFDDGGGVGLLDPDAAISNEKVRQAVEALLAKPPVGSDSHIYQMPEELSAGEAIIEGASRTIVVNAYERDPEARRKCIEAHGTSCSACGMSFEVEYGPVAAGYIHVHHLRPLAEVGAAHAVDPVADLLPVCPNCHAVIHCRVPPYSIDEVRAFRQQRHI